MPLPLRVVEAFSKLCFFHVFQWTRFITAQSYVAFHCMCEIDLSSMSSSCHPPVFPYHCRPATVSDHLTIEVDVKRRKDRTDYFLLRQGGARVTWHAVKFETVVHATVLVHDYFELVDSK